MVKLDVPLQFCIEAGEKGGCAARECTRLHLCPFFIKGSCKFGSQCKRSHNFGDEHTVRVLDHFRLRFLNTYSSSSLLQELLKMILDESELQRAAAKRSVPDICKFYNKGICKKEDKCPCLHVCEHFIDGDCKFGVGCKREHDFCDPHNRNVLEEYDMDERISDFEVLQRLKGRERKRPSSGSFEIQIPQKVGAKNETELQRAAAKRSLPEICKFYNKGVCKKEDKCPCLHVCEHFIDGDCKFGVVCKREHDFYDPHNRNVLEEYDMDERVSYFEVLQCLKRRERKRPSSGSFEIQIPQKVRAKGASPNTPYAKAKYEKEKDTEICGFNLCGKCYYGNRCIRRHTELPYMWEFAVDGDNWESFSSDLNTTLEHSYCGVQNGDCTVMIRGVLYCVQFTDMSAVPVLSHFCAGTSSFTNPKTRRLSTTSSVVAAAGHVFSTKWQWYWQDENNKWQSYDTPNDGHAASTTNSQCLESEFAGEKDCHFFSVSHRKYTMYFKEWYQENDVHKSKRPVRRRPAEFVTKQNMKDIIAERRRKASLTHSRISSASSEPDGLPSHWSPISGGEDYLCVRLDITSEEYKTVEKKFRETMDVSRNITKIERVQNPDLWTCYSQKRSRMAKKAGKDPEERQLFHGTKADTVEAICQQGFDWRVCGKHGTVYGKGSYFACKASYSHDYTAMPFTSGSYKQMFLARVLVGSYTNGNSSLTRPPPKDPSNPHVLFDSCCDNKTNPALYVIFENGQSYPEYLITYV